MTVGLVDVDIGIVRRSSRWPAADRIMAEMDPLFRYLPGYACLTAEDRDRLRPIVIDVFSPHATGSGTALVIEDEAYMAFGRVSLPNRSKPKTIP